jgi:hypothetical protein
VARREFKHLCARARHRLDDEPDRRFGQMGVMGVGQRALARRPECAGRIERAGRIGQHVHRQRHVAAGAVFVVPENERNQRHHRDPDRDEVVGKYLENQFDRRLQRGWQRSTKLMGKLGHERPW